MFDLLSKRKLVLDEHTVLLSLKIHTEIISSLPQLLVLAKVPHWVNYFYVKFMLPLMAWGIILGD